MFARTAMTAVLIAGVAVGIAPAAQAKDGEIIRTGNCSGSADWKLKAKPDDGAIEVEFEVDSNRVGQTWNVTLRDNGVLVWSGRRVTLAPSGSFSVERHIRNRAGSDQIVGRAVHTATGQVCRGVLVFGG